ncbi:MAG: hypothetical protein U9N30_08640 [Campylobacterota bacterium]|nr:hypothetical protein [Campylobacterota bacterium]
MIGKIITLVIVVSIMVVLFLSMSTAQKMTVIVNGNMDKKPIDIVLHHFQDSDCGMPIEDMNYASQVVANSGNTWFFHDHGGLAHWMQDKEFKDELVVWIWAIDSQKWIDGRKAWYSFTEDTPMAFGFGGYEHKKEKMIDFKTMYLRVLRNETMANPYYVEQLRGSN